MFKDKAQEIALAAARAQRILDAKIAAEIKAAEERELARQAEAALLAQRIAEHGRGPQR
jgi:hypothetical protein